MKKVLSLVLVLTLVLGSFSFAFADTANPTDNERVNKLIELGLVLGDAGGYRLNDTITRAEAAVLVTKALDLNQVAQASKYASSFKDVALNHWALGYINVAAGRGIVNGYPDGTFRPDAKISYAEIITMMVQVLGGLNEQEAKAPWPANMITKASELGILKDVSISNFAEIAVREKVFEVVYNTITSQKAGNYQVVKAIVLENNRVQTLKGNEIVVEVIEEVQKANFVTESRSGYEKGRNINVTISKDLGDVEDLLGKIVDISFDKSGKAVKVEVDKTYEYLTGYVTASEKSLTVNDKKYTVQIDERYSGKDDRLFRTYYNNQDYKYADFYQDPTTKTTKDSFYAEFARVTVKDGKVLYIDAFNFSDIAPVKGVRKDGAEVIILDDNRDGATKKINLDKDTFVIEVDAESKAIKRSDLASIEADQVIHYIAEKDYANTVFVRTDAKLTGKYEKARSSKIEGVTATELYVDGEYYVALTAKAGRKAVYTYDLEKFATLEGTQRQIDERLDSYKDKEVVLLLDMNDKVQYVAAEVKDNHFIGMIDNILGTEIKIVNVAIEAEVYVARMASTLINDYTKTLKEARIQDFERGDLVRVQLDEEGYIKTLVKLADYQITAANWANTAYAGYKHREAVADKATKNDTLTYNSNNGTVTVEGVKSYITKDTVVFINTAKVLKATTMSDVNSNYVLVDANGYPVAKAYVLYDAASEGKENIAKVIVFNTISAKSAGTEKITRQVVKHEYTGGTNYLIVADEKGEVKTHEVTESSVVAKLAAGDIVELTVTKNDAQVISAAKILIDADQDNVYRIERKNDRRIVLVDEKGNERYFWISAKALQFGSIEEAVNVQIKADSLAEGSLIDIIVETDEDVVGVFEKTSTTTPVAGEYKVTTDFALTDTIIVLNGKAYSLIVSSAAKLLDKAGDPLTAAKIPAGVDVEVTFVEGTQQVYIVKVLNYTDAELNTYLTNMATVATAKGNLALGFTTGDSVSSVTGNLTLAPTQDGATVTWKSSNAAVITDAGVVTRPASNNDDVKVTLTATITAGTVTDTKEFVVTVKRLPSNNANLSLLRIGGQLIDLTQAETGAALTLQAKAGDVILVEFKLADSKATHDQTSAVLINGVYTQNIVKDSNATQAQNVAIQVTAEDGTIKTYTVNLTLNLAQ